MLAQSNFSLVKLQFFCSVDEETKLVLDLSTSCEERLQKACDTVFLFCESSEGSASLSQSGISIQPFGSISEVAAVLSGFSSS